MLQKIVRIGNRRCNLWQVMDKRKLTEYSLLAANKKGEHSMST